MEVLVTLLLCTIAFLLYLLNKNRNEISELKAEIHRLHQNGNNKSVPPPADEKIFVSVIFKEHDQKYYDYFLGDNHDVKVGDLSKFISTIKFPVNLNGVLRRSSTLASLVKFLNMRVQKLKVKPAVQNGKLTNSAPLSITIKFFQPEGDFS